MLSAVADYSHHIPPSVCLSVGPSDVWEDRDAGLHSDQQEQQLPDVSSGCSAPLQVSFPSSGSQPPYEDQLK